MFKVKNSNLSIWKGEDLSPRVVGRGGVEWILLVLIPPLQWILPPWFVFFKSLFFQVNITYFYYRFLKNNNYIWFLHKEEDITMFKYRFKRQPWNFIEVEPWGIYRCIFVVFFVFVITCPTFVVRSSMFLFFVFFFCHELYYDIELILLIRPSLYENVGVCL